MREFRIIWMVASIFAAAIVAVFVVVILQLHRQTPPPAPKQASVPNNKIQMSSKSSARVLAPTTLKYYRVKVALDGTLRADQHTFHLYAADIPGREYACTYRNGQRWACGLRAYVALLNLVGSDPIECHPAYVGKPDIVVCHNGNIDLAERMLKDGWAHLQAGVTDERYVEAAKAAKDGKVGMWMDAPPPQHDATAQ